MDSTSKGSVIDYFADAAPGEDVAVNIPDGTDFNNYFADKEKSSFKLIDYEQYRITESTPIKEPVPVITINNEIIATEGNIITISGASKSGKSAFTGWIIAGAIISGGTINDELESLAVALNLHHKAVIHIDTEQARHKHQYNVKSILRRAGLDACPEYFLSYNIRQLDLNEYALVTTGICEAASKKFGGIHLIVIDGIADYISDVNDPAQSNAIVKYFEELAIMYSTPIIVIVHTNPGSDKERGHVGSQCQRKSESVLIVKSEGDISYLEPKLLRMAGKADIPLLQFKYDKEKGYHVSCGIRIGEQQNKDADRIELIKVIGAKAFAPPIALKYNEAIEKIMKHSNKQERAAKDMFKEMHVHQLIVQGTDKFWRLKMEDENDAVQ